MGGWVDGLVVGKSDFNENPVVSPDLDMDFGLRLRVCQYDICLSPNSTNAKQMFGKYQNCVIASKNSIFCYKPLSVIGFNIIL